MLKLVILLRLYLPYGLVVRIPGYHPGGPGFDYRYGNDS